MPYLDGPEWIPVCTNCPLHDCRGHDSCPIEIAHEKEMPPDVMVQIEKLVGEQQPIIFRELIYQKGLGNMKEGLLWFDNDPRRRLAEKVSQAATRYQVKFGQRPTICYVNEAELNGQEREVEGVKIQPVPDVLRYHFWVGVENETIAEAR